MKLINKFQSPNFNNRKSNQIKFIVIHYTALENCKNALSYLCDPKNKVSSHYLISQNGEIYNLVNEKKRAWHAGISYWDNYRDLNSLSIGIELDFSNNKKNNKYSLKMTKSLFYLLNRIKTKYRIKNYNILGHSDIAPYRKKDPGPKFIWNKLIKKNLAFKPKIKTNMQINIANQFLKKNNLKNRKQKFLFIFNYIGYDISYAKQNNYSFKKLITAYQMRFLQSNITGNMDNITFEYLFNHFTNKLLTKN